MNVNLVILYCLVHSFLLHSQNCKLFSIQLLLDNNESVHSNVQNQIY